MLGNFVTGTSVLAPAGMLPDLAAGLGVTIRDAGLLITFGLTNESLVSSKALPQKMVNSTGALVNAFNGAITVTRRL